MMNKKYECECGNSKVELLSIGNDKKGYEVFVGCPQCKKLTPIGEANTGFIYFDLVEYDELGNILTSEGST